MYIKSTEEMLHSSRVFTTGVGFGLMYLPSIVMVGYYFDKRRALATGIAVCGSGIGSFVFAPLTEVSQVKRYLLSVVVTTIVVRKHKKK